MPQSFVAPDYHHQSANTLGATKTIDINLCDFLLNNMPAQSSPQSFVMQHQERPYIVPVCEEPINTLYQDEYIIVLEKPALLLSTPGRHPLNRDSVLTRLQSQFNFANLAHRLDLDTSGILVAGLEKKALANLNEQFAKRQVDKEYIAVLDGIVEQDQGVIDLPLMTDWPNRPLQKVCFDDGKPSITEYTVLERDHQNLSTRVIFKPITGRSHQLRLHSSSIGHAILGCDMYAPMDAYQKSERLLLHAQKLAFNHPITQKRLSFECPAPF